MKTEKERTALKTVYKSRKWLRKVDLMTDAQIIAVFMRLREQQKV